MGVGDDTPLELPDYPSMIRDQDGAPAIGPAIDAWAVLVASRRVELEVLLTAPELDVDDDDRARVIARLEHFDARYEEDMARLSGFLAGRIQAINAVGPSEYSIPAPLNDESDAHLAGRFAGVRITARHLAARGEHDKADRLANAVALLDPTRRH